MRRQVSIGRISALRLEGRQNVSSYRTWLGRGGLTTSIPLVPTMMNIAGAARFISSSSAAHYSHTSKMQAYNTMFEDNEPIISQEEAEKMLETWSASYHLPISTVIGAILQDKTYKTYINAQALDFVNWENFVKSRRRALVLDPVSVLGSYDEVARFKELLDEAFFEVDMTKVQSMNKTSSSFLYCKQMLFDLLLKKAETQLKEVIDTNRVLAMTSDLRIPHEWYPHARIMKRKIFYHGGPTNSGKTYNAIQRLKQADPKLGGGLYCGPLRLLALEIYEQLNKQGISIDLLTGQEKKEVPGSTHTSCTIEMISTTKEYDVAVVDEIQMIADNERGHVWTKALLGLRAREIHLCGGLEASQLVESLCKSTNDEFTLVKYDRLSTLQIEEQSLQGDYSKIQPGDCVVAFSIADIFSIRKEIESRTKHKCAVIYGQLPSETRSTQARLFNDPNSGYDVLVASDAIGMGLNLNIRRIVFHTTLKRHGNSVEGSFYIDPSHIKQIAGRAGRKSSNFPIGYVTTWQEIDLAYVKSVMQVNLPQIKSAGLFPSADQIQSFYEQVKKLLAKQSEERLLAAKSEDNLALTSGTSNTDSKKINKKSGGKIFEEEYEADKHVMESDFKQNPDNMRISMIISRFVELSKVDGRYFMCNHDSLLTISNWLHTIPLPLSDRFVFSNAPVNFNFSLAMKQLYTYAAMYAAKRPVPLGIRLPTRLPRALDEFADLCVKHNTIDLYLWLAFRFPKYFIERETALELKKNAISQIERTLSTKTLRDSYSFRRSYGDMRHKMMKKGDLLTLPPLEFGDEIRETTRRNVEMIPKHLRIVLHEANEDVKVEDLEKLDAELGRRKGPHLASNFRTRAEQHQHDDISSSKEGNEGDEPLGAETIVLDTGRNPVGIQSEQQHAV